MSKQHNLLPLSMPVVKHITNLMWKCPSLQLFPRASSTVLSSPESTQNRTAGLRNSSGCPGYVSVMLRSPRILHSVERVRHGLGLGLTTWQPPTVGCSGSFLLQVSQCVQNSGRQATMRISTRPWLWPSFYRGVTTHCFTTRVFCNFSRRRVKKAGPRSKSKRGGNVLAFSSCGEVAFFLPPRSFGTIHLEPRPTALVYRQRRPGLGAW